MSAGGLEQGGNVEMYWGRDTMSLNAFIVWCEESTVRAPLKFEEQEKKVSFWLKEVTLNIFLVVETAEKFLLGS